MLHLLFFLPLSASISITVDTSRGYVQGFDHDFGNDTSQRFYGYGQVFLGIPYAKAPLEERRFTLPEDICRYTEDGSVQDATYYRPRCYQIEDDLQPATNMSEDCLYLNVVSPDVNGSYPVMVYIHGAGLQTGGADVYHWKGTIRNLVSRGVVVVTTQYRLGVIGFFTTLTERFPPNRGCYDIILALKWVKEEIGNFGGESNRVTTFGQSAGASAVSDLSLTPLARGLFHQLIQTSGSVLFEIETPQDPRGSIHKERASQICEIDGYNWGSKEKDDAIMKCLLAATPEQLIEYDGSTNKTWNPTLDGAYWPDYPQNLAKYRPKYPLLMTDMLEEYAYFLPGIHQNNISTIGPDTIKQVFSEYWPNYDNIYTGFEFDEYMTPHQENENKEIWLFTFTHRNRLGIPIDVDGWIPVGHCSELPFLWFYPDVFDNASVVLTDDDFAVADQMGRIYTDFAINGELPYERGGQNRSYVSRDRKEPDAKDKLEEMRQIIGEFPPILISEEWWAKLDKLGKNVLKTWNSMECSVHDQKLSTTINPGHSNGVIQSAISWVDSLVRNVNDVV